MAHLGIVPAAGKEFVLHLTLYQTASLDLPLCVLAGQHATIGNVLGFKKIIFAIDKLLVCCHNYQQGEKLC